MNDNILEKRIEMVSNTIKKAIVESRNDGAVLAFKTMKDILENNKDLTYDDIVLLVNKFLMDKDIHDEASKRGMSDDALKDLLGDDDEE